MLEQESRLQKCEELLSECHLFIPTHMMKRIREEYYSVYRVEKKDLDEELKDLVKEHGKIR
jgi:hypothetical protein